MHVLSTPNNKILWKSYQSHKTQHVRPGMLNWSSASMFTCWSYFTSKRCIIKHHNFQNGIIQSLLLLWIRLSSKHTFSLMFLYGRKKYCMNYIQNFHDFFNITWPCVSPELLSQDRKVYLQNSFFIIIKRSVEAWSQYLLQMYREGASQNQSIEESGILAQA